MTVADDLSNEEHAALTAAPIKAVVDELKIEKGVPIPEQRGARHNWSILNKMEIGDSIFIPRGSRASLESARTSICSVFRRYPNRKFTTRALRAQDAIRVWRIK